MAGETLSYTELKNWYTIFNNIIADYGGSLTQKPVPASGSYTTPNDINNLFTIIDEMANEEYLSTQPLLYDTDYTIVSSGSRILRSSTAPISNTTNKLSQIKCRNKVSYSSGTNNSGSKGNGAFNNTNHGNVACSSGSCSNGQRDNGSYTSGPCVNGTNNHGYNSYLTRSCGSNSHGSNTNGNQTNGGIYDILNANTSY